jgi:hypothetical protein
MFSFGESSSDHEEDNQQEKHVDHARKVDTGQLFIARGF